MNFHMATESSLMYNRLDDIRNNCLTSHQDQSRLHSPVLVDDSWLENRIEKYVLRS